MGVDKLLYLLVSCNLKEIGDDIKLFFAGFIEDQPKYIYYKYKNNKNLLSIMKDDWVNLNKINKFNYLNSTITPHNSIWNEFVGTWKPTRHGNGNINKNKRTIKNVVKNHFMDITENYFFLTEEDEISINEITLQYNLEEYFKNFFKNYTDHENGYQYKDNKIISLKEGWIKEYPINDY